MEEIINPELIAEFEACRVDFIRIRGHAPDQLFVSPVMFAGVLGKIPEERENLVLLGMRVLPYFYIPSTHCALRSEEPYCIKIYPLNTH